MTEYEKLVKEGKMAPMNGLDWLLLQSLVEDLLLGKDTMDDDLFEALDGMMIEIEHWLRDDEDRLNRLKGIMQNYTKSKE
jgi:hypothetical protein